MRTKAFNRDISYRKAKRKQRITEEVYWGGKERPYYDNLHQYSKNKIHCSCAWCSTKTRNKGKRRLTHANYNRNINYRRADLRRQLAMDDSMREAGYNVARRRVTEWI